MDRWRENNDRARANEWTCRAHHSCRGGPFEQIALGIPPHRAQAKALFRAARTALCTNLLGKSLAFEQGVNYAAHPWGTPRTEQNPSKKGGDNMNDLTIASSVKTPEKGSLLAEFEMDEDVAELAIVDDLWYFIKKKGNWIAGSG